MTPPDPPRPHGPKDDEGDESDRERRYQLELSWRRLAAAIAWFIAVLALFAAASYGCTQVLGDDDAPAVSEEGPPAEDAAPTEPAGDPTGDDEVTTDPSGSRPPLECTVGDTPPDSAALAAEEAAIREAADQEFVEERLGSTAGAVTFDEGSYIFTMTVFGDGEMVAMSPLTRWYNPRFVVNNDPATNTYDDGGGFAVDVNFRGGGDARSNVFDEDFSALPAEQASAEAVWLDSSTLQVTATIDGPQLEVTRMRVELSVRLEDADGNETATFGSDACWTAG